MLDTLRHPRLWLVIGWMLVVGAIIVSLIPTRSLPPLGVSDKFEHTVTYAVLTLWFAGLYPRTRYFWIGVGMFALGTLIEFAQGAMNLGRHRDYLDVLANSVGIAIGLGLALAGLGDWVQRVEGWRRRS